MKFLLNKIIPYVSALVAGGLLPLAFAPVCWFWLAIVSSLILLWLWQNCSAKQAFLRGWSYGLGVFGVGVSWVFVSIHVFGNVGILLSSLLTLLLVMLLALFFGFQGFIFNWFLSTAGRTGFLFLFSTIWLLFEWLRSWIFTGFPWLLIGYSQTNSPLKGFIPIVGEYGTGFLVIFTSAMIFWVIKTIFLTRLASSAKLSATMRDFGFSLGAREESRALSIANNGEPNRKTIKLILVIASIFIIWVAGYFLSWVNWTKHNGKPLKVSLVQGNISQNIKWSPQFVNFILHRYVDLTAEYPNSDLIVWPEGAIPIPLPQANPLLQQLDSQAKAIRAALLTGIPVLVPNSFNNYYNGMVALGEGNGRYYKKHLVPFGEYIPFKTIFGDVFAILRIPMPIFVAGPPKQMDLVVKNIPIAPFICYEIAYADVVRASLPKAQLLITISDDAWFGDSFAPAQHLQIGQFRAIETGRELLFVGNNGITAIVNNYGKVLKHAPQFQPYNLSGAVQPRIGTTPWIKLGNWPIIAALFLIIGFFCYRKVKRKK